MMMMMMMMLEGGQQEEGGVCTREGKNCSRGFLLSYFHSCPFSLLCCRPRREVWKEAQDYFSGAAAGYGSSFSCYGVGQLGIYCFSVANLSFMEQKNQWLSPELSSSSTSGCFSYHGPIQISLPVSLDAGTYHRFLRPTCPRHWPSMVISVCPKWVSTFWPGVLMLP